MNETDHSTASHKPARLPQLAWILHLANRHRHELGFLPRAAFLEYLKRGCIWITYENETEAGYVLWRPPPRRAPNEGTCILRIIQACIQLDARRQLHAMRLVRDLEAQVNSATPTYIACWCADDLEANAFWQAIGFEHYATRTCRTHNRITRVHRAWIRQVATEA